MNERHDFGEHHGENMTAWAEPPTAFADPAAMHDSLATARDMRSLGRDDRAAAARDGRAGTQIGDAEAGFAQGRKRGEDRASMLEAELATLRDALHSRNIIGQAQGLLMERYGTDADGAFRTLVRLSQQTHRKLRDVAQQLVQTTIDAQRATGGAAPDLDHLVG